MDKKSTEDYMKSINNLGSPKMRSIVIDELEKWWIKFDENTDIKIKDIEKLKSLHGKLIERCDQFVSEARKSRDRWKGIANEWQQRFKDLGNKQTKEKKNETKK